MVNIFVGGISGKGESSEKAKKIIADYHTDIEIDTDGLEVYAPEPYEHIEMVRRSNERQQIKYNKYLAEQRNKEIHKAKVKTIIKNKKRMTKNSKRQNRRK